MRTTIRLADDTRGALQGLAKERGLSGPSLVVEEAIRFYLAERNRPAAAAPAAPAPEPAPSIRLADETRQALQALAEERGLADPALILEEAVRFYLAERNRPAVVVVEAAPLPEPARRAVPAMFGFPLWGVPFAMFGFPYWNDLLRRSLRPVV
jgi:predicted transcriptional regulator